MNDQSLTKYATFILRVSLGIMFIAHGLLKVLVFTLPGTAQFFEGVGFPG
jgi:putative oxidoreductase